MRRFVILTLAMLLLAPLAHAGDISLFGSGWDMGDADTVYGGGFRLTGWEGPWAADFTIAWMDDSTYYWNGWGYYYTENVQVTPLELGLRYMLQENRSFRPYLGGGFGYYLTDSDYADVDDSWGGYILGGFNIGDPQSFDFFAELVYRWVDVDAKWHNPDNDETGKWSVDLAGLAFNLGVVIHF